MVHSIVWVFSFSSSKLGEMLPFLLHDIVFNKLTCWRGGKVKYCGFFVSFFFFAVETYNILLFECNRIPLCIMYCRKEWIGSSCHSELNGYQFSK